MANSVYPINKGINQPLVFKGLKAQYIWYLGGGLVILLILFAVLYIIGINTFIILITIGGAGAFLFTKVYKLSKTHGQYGMMKQAAKRMLSKEIKCRSRAIFKK
jgi:hypothetical protein